jgi:hypothetical protein
MNILRFRPPADAPGPALAVFCQAKGLALREGRSILANPSGALAIGYIGWIRDRHSEWRGQGGHGDRDEFEDWLDGGGLPAGRRPTHPRGPGTSARALTKA